jgi:hypothetical protein
VWAGAAQPQPWNLVSLLALMLDAVGGSFEETPTAASEPRTRETSNSDRESPGQTVCTGAGQNATNCAAMGDARDIDTPDAAKPNRSIAEQAPERQHKAAPAQQEARASKRKDDRGHRDPSV